MYPPNCIVNNCHTLYIWSITKNLPHGKILMSKKQKWYIRENNPNDTYTMQNAGTFIQFTVSMGALSESHFFSSPEIFWLNCVLHLSVHRYVVNFSHFQLPLQNDCMPSHQTYHKCSSRGPEEGLYLFEVLRIPSSLSWLLIGRHIFHFFSRTTAYEISRFARNVSLGVLKKCFSVVWKIQHGLSDLWLP